MYLLQEINPSGLKQFARELLAQDETFWSLEQTENGEERITWPSYEQDCRLILGLLTILESTTGVKDEEFVKNYIPVVEAVIKTSPMFQRLDYGDIKVTKGHLGTTPYLHTSRVLRSLDTSLLSPGMRVLHRLIAIFHDIGKALSAGLGDKILELMERFSHPKHSHPSHAEVSTLIFGELLKDDEIAKRLEKIIPGGAKVTQGIILNHHLFEDLQEKVPVKPKKAGESITLADDVVTEFSQFTSEQWLVLLHVFLFSRADMGSNQQYHQYWRGKNWMLLNILRQFWDQIECEAKVLALSYFKLTKELVVVDDE